MELVSESFIELEQISTKRVDRIYEEMKRKNQTKQIKRKSKGKKWENIIGYSIPFLFYTLPLLILLIL